MSENIIPFNAPERLLAKVNHYLSAVDQLVSNGDAAFDHLVAAFAVADEDMKIKIVLLLGALANPKVVAPLLRIMQDSRLGDSIRQAAAIQLSVVGGMLNDSDALVDQLLEELQNQTPFERANAAFALGWEGNRRAAPFLIECLFDQDTEVQQAAVNALSCLGEDNIFTVLAERLQKSPKAQQRAILYNLGHFASRHDDVAMICKAFLRHEDADLRYDALVILHTVSEPTDHIPLYNDLLNDSDKRIRELALIRMAAFERNQLIAFEDTIRALLDDANANIHQAAVRLLHRIHPAAVVRPSGASRKDAEI